MIYKKILLNFNLLLERFKTISPKNNEKNTLILELLLSIQIHLKNDEFIHADLLAYTKELLDSYEEIDAELKKDFNSFFSSARIFVSNQYINENSQQCNAVGVLLFTDPTRDNQPFTILFNYLKELSTLGVRVTNDDAALDSEKIFENALKRRLKELGLESDNISQIDRDKYGYHEQSIDYRTQHYFVRLKNQSKEEIYEKIKASDVKKNQASNKIDNHQLIKQFTRNFEIISLDDFVQNTKLVKKNTSSDIPQSDVIEVKFLETKVRLSTALMLRLIWKNKLYLPLLKNLPMSPKGLSDEEIAQICEYDGKEFISPQITAIASWYQEQNETNKNQGEVVQTKAGITLLKFLDNPSSISFVQHLNPALIQELVYRLFESTQNESRWFHENLGYWFTDKDRLILQVATVFFIFNNSGSNNLTREQSKKLLGLLRMK